MGSDLQNEAGFAMGGIVARDYPEDVQRGRDGIRRARESGHHSVADRLDDRARMLLHCRAEQCEMLANQRLGIEIAKPPIHGSRPLEVREQQGHLTDTQTFLLVDVF